MSIFLVAIYRAYPGLTDTLLHSLRFINNN